MRFWRPTAAESAFALLLAKVTKGDGIKKRPVEKGVILIERTVSAMVGKGSTRHNSRKFMADNIVKERTPQNVEYCNEKIEDVYHQLFDEALERFNAKQKRNDRKIDDYYEAGEEVEMVIYRLEDGEYKEMTIEIELGDRKDTPLDPKNEKSESENEDEEDENESEADAPRNGKQDDGSYRYEFQFPGDMGDFFGNGWDIFGY